jgi:hypothetical protein
MSSNHIPGHLYGPRVPHMGFWYGQNYLGEVRFPFLSRPGEQVQDAKAKLGRSIGMLNPGPAGFAMVRRLHSLDCEVRIYR